MKLHGQFENDTKEVKVKESWNWLRDGQLKRETEALIMAAQEQALNTNSIKKHIYKTSESDLCRLCSKNVENVTHIVSGCEKLAQKEYKKRHDKVCLYIHWALCKKHGFPTSPNWYEHVPEQVLENDDTKLLWDFAIQVDRVLNAGEEDENANRPDIVILNKKSRSCLLIDVAIPNDHNIKEKEEKKIKKYTDLKLEVSKIWNCSSKVIPVIVGALGSVTKNLEKHLKSIEVDCKISVIQKSALLGTANILRKFLSV